MKKKNFFVTSILAAVVLSSVFFSLAAAQESNVAPDPTVVPDQAQADSPDNSTTNQADNDVLYTIQDNSTASQRDLAPEVPGAEDANLIATQTNSDNNLPIIAGAVVLAIVVGALGVFCWHRKSVKKQN